MSKYCFRAVADFSRFRLSPVQCIHPRDHVISTRRKEYASRRMMLATGQLTHYEPPMMRGHVDLISPHLISGWAIDDACLDQPVDISIFADDRKLAQVTCSGLRTDLREKGGFGDGRHGFRYEPSPPLVSTSSVRVTVRHAVPGALLGGGDVMLPADTAVRPPDLNVDVPRGFLALPAPERPREMMELFGLYDGRTGLFNLLSQVDFTGRTPQQVHYSVFGALAGPVVDPVDWSPALARDALNDLLLSPAFQRNILRLFLDAFPEKRRLLFVHIPKCAGSDLSSHLVTRYPSVPERLRAALWTSKRELFEELSDIVRRLPFSNAIFVRGHINLADYLEQGLARPCDRLFTILRDPVEVAISQVNYILTRLKGDTAAGTFQPDTREWLRLLQTEMAPGEVSDTFLRQLGERALREPQIVRPDSMCHWLGDGDAKEVLARLDVHGVEVTNTREYGRWLRERWGINSRTRQNESLKFLTRDTLRSEDLAYLRGISEQDEKLYSAVEHHLLQTGACSVTGGIAIPAIPEAAAAA
jgi:hypothetical protein